MGRCGVLLLLLVGQLAPAGALAQDEAKPFGQGTHALRGIIRSPKPIPGYSRKFDLEPLHDFSRIDTANTVIIVLGDPQPLLDLEQQTSGLRRFVTNGGALLVATDHTIDEPLAGQFRVEVSGGFYQGEPADSFADLPDCPVARQLAPGHPLFRRVETIATNRPSVLALQPSSPLQILAKLPLRSRRLTRESIRPVQTPFIAGGELGKGRILVISDHSIFINDMMLQADTDNFDFAYNCVDWLSGSGQRKHVLFIDDGEIVTNFNVSFKPSLPREDLWKIARKAWQVFWDAPREQKLELLERLPWDKLAAIAGESVDLADRAMSRLERIMAEQQSRDAPNRLANQVFRNRQGYLQFMLGLATLGLILYGLRRLQASRHRIDKAVPLLAGPTLPISTSPIMDLRRRAMLEADNCAEVAQYLARRCLQDAGCSRWDQAPTFSVQGSLLKRWQARRQLRWLWQLAAAPRTPRVSPRQLDHVVALTEEMKTAFAARILKKQ